MTCGARHGRRAASLPPAAVLVTAVVLLASGCSGGPGDGAGAEPRAGHSASASASPSTASTTSSSDVAPSPPPARRGKESERAFARYVMKAWGYALRANDPRPLTRLSPHGSPCRGCTDLARTLHERRKQGWAVRFPGVVVRSIEVTERHGKAAKGAKKATEAHAVAKVDIPPSDSYNADGSFRNANRAHPNARFEVLMRYTSRGYRLLSFTVS